MKLATTNYSLLFLSYPLASFAVLYSFPTFSFSSTFSQSSRHGRQGSSSISMHSWRNFCSKWVLAKTQTVCIPAQPELPFYLLIVEMGRSQVGSMYPHLLQHGRDEGKATKKHPVPPTWRPSEKSCGHSRKYFSIPEIYNKSGDSCILSSVICI